MQCKNNQGAFSQDVTFRCSYVLRVSSLSCDFISDKLWPAEVSLNSLCIIYLPVGHFLEAFISKALERPFPKRFPLGGYDRGHFVVAYHKHHSVASRRLMMQLFVFKKVNRKNYNGNRQGY